MHNYPLTIILCVASITSWITATSTINSNDTAHVFCTRPQIINCHHGRRGSGGIGARVGGGLPVYHCLTAGEAVLSDDSVL